MAQGKGDYKGRSDYGCGKKGKIDVPAESGKRGIPAGMPGRSDITTKGGGKGGVDSPTEKGDRGKLMQKGGTKSDKRPEILGAE